MGALAVPRKMQLTKTNSHLCARLGVRFNGKDMPDNVFAYDLDKQTVTIRSGVDAETLHGKVEAYWR